MTNTYTIQRPGCKVSIFIPKNRDESIVLGIYPKSDSNLEFRDIEVLLGKWKLNHESKTSSVRFLYKNPQTQDMALVYVHLLDPPKNPGSYVLSIQILRGSPSADSR